MEVIAGVFSIVLKGIIAICVLVLREKIEQLRGNFLKTAIGLASAWKEGGFSVKEDQLQDFLDKAGDLPPEVEALSVKLCDGHIAIRADVNKYSAKLGITMRVEIHRFCLSSYEKSAVFRMMEEPEIEFRSLIARLGRGIIRKKVEHEMNPERLCEAVNKTFPNLLSFEWPSIHMHLEELPQMQALNKLAFKGRTVWDFLEVHELEAREKELLVKTRLVKKGETLFAGNDSFRANPKK